MNTNDDNKENICPNRGPYVRSEACVQLLAGLKDNLRGNCLPHQVEGILWLASRECDENTPKAILADEMGVGKTLQVLGLIAARPQTEPTLVVTPKSLCHQWRSEIGKFLPSMDARVFTRKDWMACKPQCIRNMIIITNYDSIRTTPVVTQLPWGRVICDEAHTLKNVRSKISQTIRRLLCSSMIFLTGTPITNTRKDLAGLLQNLHIDFSNLGEEDTLNALRTKYVLRRSVKEISDHMSDICFINHPVDLTTEESESYNELCYLGRQCVEEQEGMSALDIISKLRQQLTTGQVFLPFANPIVSKIEKTKDILKECKTHDHKCIVFTQFKEEMNTLFDVLKEIKYTTGRLEGATPPKKRQTMIDEFIQLDGPACLLVNMRVGSCGLNLQAADTIILYSPHWLASEEMQSISRCHRLGQTEAVTVHRIFVRNTIEEYMLQGQRKKVFHASEMLGDDHDDMHRKMGFESMQLDDIKACFHPHE
jgi:SNF2 family DNA or RNA helicase